MRESILEPYRPQMTTWGMRIARWITKATNIRSECVIIIAFPPQQWLHERASILRNTHIACPVSKLNNFSFMCLKLLRHFTIRCLIDLILIHYVLW